MKYSVNNPITGQPIYVDNELQIEEIKLKIAKKLYMMQSLNQPVHIVNTTEDGAVTFDIYENDPSWIIEDESITTVQEIQPVNIE